MSPLSSYPHFRPWITSKRIPKEAGSKEREEETGHQIKQIWITRTTGAEARTRRPLESPPEREQTRDDTDNAETLQDANSIHTTNELQLDKKVSEGSKRELSDMHTY